jgi:hypothetical protein
MSVFSTLGSGGRSILSSRPSGQHRKTQFCRKKIQQNTLETVEQYNVGERGKEE